MNEVITIENTEMQIREYAGQRVVTFKDIDTVHQRPTGTARNAFRRNKQRFEEGKHYFVLKTDEDIGENPNVRLTYIRNIVVPNRGITVLTERGYLMLVKAFTDDLSWQVQDRLVEVYFRVKEQHQEPPKSEQELIDDFINSTPKVPMVSDWYERNKGRMERMCTRCGKTRRYMYHCILERVGEKYDLQKANEIYKNEVGYYPDYPMDIISYFPELGKEADKYLDRLEKSIYGL